MVNTKNLLAVDIGAGSGRGILGRYNGKKISIEELYRYPNGPVRINKHLYWDVLRLFCEIKKSLQIASAYDISSVGIDTWGLDFGLLTPGGELLGNPYHYRDSQTDNMMIKAFGIMPKEEIFKRTGIQFMKINTIYQLLAIKERAAGVMLQAANMLLMPDLFNYYLTGVKAVEYTNATTTQLINLETKTWDKSIIKIMDFPEKIFSEIIKPATVLGNISNTVSEEIGIKKLKVLATASHDTASAVAAIPSKSEKFIYISCGTWSLIGTEIDNPIISKKAHDYNFTNEGGVDGKVRLLKNVDGLWLLQQCKKQWEFEDNLSISYDKLHAESDALPGHKYFIDPEAGIFLSAIDMPMTIRKYCRETGQQVPETRGEITKCILESLALKYRRVIEMLEEILEYSVEEIYMVGGGIKSRGLCQYTANALGRVVKAGPVEATAIGNLMVQLKGLGEVETFKDIREIVMNSFEIEEYLPRDRDKWDAAYKRFIELSGRDK